MKHICLISAVILAATGAASAQDLPQQLKDRLQQDLQLQSAEGKAWLYEERIGQSSPAAIEGMTAWAIEQIGSGPPTAKATISIPSRSFTAVLALKRNEDKTLLASHLATIQVMLGADSPIKAIDNVQRMALKLTERERGEALVAIPLKVSPEVHLLALNGTPAAVERNTALMHERNWIDLPIVYSNGQRALITIAINPEGRKALDKAMRVDQAPQSPLATPAPKGQRGRLPDTVSTVPVPTLKPENLTAQLLAGGQKPQEVRPDGKKEVLPSNCAAENLIWVRDINNLQSYHEEEHALYVLRASVAPEPGSWALHTDKGIRFFNDGSAGIGIPARALMPIDEKTPATDLRQIQLGHLNPSFGRVMAYMLEGDLYLPRCNPPGEAIMVTKKKLDDDQWFNNFRETIAK